MLSVSDSGAPSNSSTPVQTSEKRCENADCNVNRLISMVPKRKTTQFISEPSVLQKPLLVNGFTAVFQVDGSSAKLMDIKNPEGGEGSPNKPIYRIVPNSHVHVVNYVVVDTDETYLKKIADNDPITMQKLLSSQKDSADQMLRKIMSGQGSSATAATTTVVSTINTGNPAANKLPDPAAAVPMTSVPKPANIATIPIQPNVLPTPPVVGSSAQGMNVPKSNIKAPIKLPVRMHPNLKITAVASAETMNTPPPPINATPPSALNAPFIQPVPLANLQSPTPVVVAAAAPPIASSSSLAGALAMNPTVQDIVDKPTYDKMQEEINDLRRTVAMLAEAQAKNQQTPSTTLATGPTRPPKRPRTLLTK